MKHSIITSIIGLAMVASVSTVAVAEDNFSILEGIQAEAMTVVEMEETQGKGCSPASSLGGCSGLFSGYFNQSYVTAPMLPGPATYYGTQAGLSNPNNTGFGTALAGMGVDNITGFYIPGGGNGFNRPVYQQPSPFMQYLAQRQYQQQMQQYRYQQAVAQAQAIRRYNQGIQNTFGGLRLANVNISCGLAYCG